jgi:HEAT repeat protein
MEFLKSMFGPPNIASLKARKNIKALIKALKHTNCQTKLDAAKALGELKESQAIEPLITLLNDPGTNDEVLEAAINALAGIDAITSVVQLVGEGSLSPHAELTAINILREMGYVGWDKISSSIRSFGGAKDAYWFKAPEVILGLVKIGTPIAIWTINDIADDLNRCGIVHVALKKMGPSALDTLLAMIECPKKFRFAHDFTVEQIAKLGNAAAIKPLITFYQKPESDHCREAIIPALESLVKQKAEEVSSADLEALAKLEGWFLNTNCVRLNQMALEEINRRK